MKIVVTAGFDGSKAAIALCELLTRSGHIVDTVLVVTPFSVTRLIEMLRQRGLSGVRKLVRKLLYGDNNVHNPDPLSKLLSDYQIKKKSLKSWSKYNGAKYKSVKSLNSAVSVDTLKKSSPDMVVYAGGGILRAPFLGAANFRVINNHSGRLPEVRGMNAIEWSILLGHEIASSIHMVDLGIDTGTIISRRPFSIMKGATLSSVRQQAVVNGIMEIVELFDDVEDVSALSAEENKGVEAGRQCFIMAPAIRELAERKLEYLLRD